MDDFIAGAKDIEKASTIKKEIQKILGNYGFPLEKWASNRKELTETSEKEKTIYEIKTLGVTWNVESDRLGYKFQEIPLEK